jgi:predicted nuclease with TOPRIM domain
MKRSTELRKVKRRLQTIEQELAKIEETQRLGLDLATNPLNEIILNLDDKIERAEDQETHGSKENCNAQADD